MIGRWLKGQLIRTGALAAVVLVQAIDHAPANATTFIIVQSTTSTQNSGLYDAILPLFEEKTGIAVRVVAVGTGQAIRNAMNCDGDVLLVHARAAEDQFVADGFGVARHDVMYNDFVVVGPAANPAGLRIDDMAAAAFGKIADRRALFASRGDDSGTHRKELALWDAADRDPSGASGTWYRETGSGMGATLNTAIAMGAYTITDRATWISFGNKGDFEVLVEDDVALSNSYGVIRVNPDHCPSTKTGPARKFVDWLLSVEGQGAIGRFRIDGRQLFFPSAN